MTKHIFVTGGVVSSLGKGITAASLGCLLKARGYSVTIQKLDPYINVDPGTMSPFQHGEVFVTDDGTETDLDLGHYERFIDENLTRESNVTAGTIYSSVIHKERQGHYLGGTVQVIPHITNEIKDRILQIASINKPDIAITEIGGTVGDIESLPFLEAIRQFRKEVGRANVLYVHVTLVPYLKSSSELKTKPTQHSVATLRSIGIQPDILVCRSEKALSENTRKKLALFCDVENDAVISAVDTDVIYRVPLLMHEEGLDRIIMRELHLNGEGEHRINLTEWQGLVDRIDSITDRVNIAIVGKYVELPDAYLSVVEALKHAGFEHRAAVDIHWVDAETLDLVEVERQLVLMDGILIPGGFGVRGIEGKIHAVQYARTRKIPFLGICLGLQCAVVEFARNVVGLERANSSEFDPATPHPVVALLPEQRGLQAMGATMRLGSYPCRLDKGSKAAGAYDSELIYERHRHRYEVNNVYREQLERAGLKISGTYPQKELVEIIEIEDHPWFVASQFHPEFKSRPTRPHPLFKGFVGAAVAGHRSGKNGQAESFALPTPQASST